MNPIATFQIATGTKHSALDVGRLAYAANPRQVLAYLEDSRDTCVYQLDLDSGESQLVLDTRTMDLVSSDGESDEDENSDACGSYAIVSPDLRCAFNKDGDPDANIQWIGYRDLTPPSETKFIAFNHEYSFSDLRFSSDGSMLYAICPSGPHTLIRIRLADAKKMKPVNWNFGESPVLPPKWKTVFEWDTSMHPTCGSLSPDEKQFAFGYLQGGVQVADLETKRIVAEFPWAGTDKKETARKLQNHELRATQVGFDPVGKQVLVLADGLLASHPLTREKGRDWVLDRKLGSVKGFAFHPSGKVLCAVFANGAARFLDALTGEEIDSYSRKNQMLISVAFSSDGSVCLVGGRKGKVVVLQGNH